MTKEQKDKIIRALAEERNDYARDCQKRVEREHGKIEGADYMLQRFLDILNAEVEMPTSIEADKEATQQIEVVINIPQKAYEQIVGFPQQTAGVDILILHKILQEGKVLPKGHGRLIDADAFDETVYRLNFETEESWEITRSEHKLINSVLYEMPTIIEADKEGAEE